MKYDLHKKAKVNSEWVEGGEGGVVLGKVGMIWGRVGVGEGGMEGGWG